jgi:uncharacterized protein YjbI with pentapeptide repeats
LANEEHVARLKQGVESWNAWRGENPDIAFDLDLVRAGLRRTDLRRADLNGADLRRADLNGAKLSEAILKGADLREADLTDANLREADLSGADLREANLTHANLREADLSGANLRKADLTHADLSLANLTLANLTLANLGEADLSEANLSEAFLKGAILVAAELKDADLTGCQIYGVSAWGLKLSEGTKQKNLVITHATEPKITVDDIEVAQFVYLLLHNQKIRHVIDTITSKAVLILGRFTEERKAVLDAMRDELRNRGYLPILFDFEKPASRDITETVSLLARMARFVLADITDAKSIPQELSLIVPDLPSVPVQPLLLNGSDEYSMFEHFRRYPWVLPIHRYDTAEQLIVDLGERVIHPAEIKVQELRGSKELPSS